MACAVLHNFIIKHARQDDILLAAVDSLPPDVPYEGDASQMVESDEFSRDGTYLRLSIGAQLWEGRNNGI